MQQHSPQQLLASTSSASPPASPNRSKHHFNSQFLIF
jgi:hypothetical protein